MFAFCTGLVVTQPHTPLKPIMPNKQWAGRSKKNLFTVRGIAYKSKQQGNDVCSMHIVYEMYRRRGTDSYYVHPGEAARSLWLLARGCGVAYRVWLWLEKASVVRTPRRQPPHKAKKIVRRGHYRLLTNNQASQQEGGGLLCFLPYVYT